MKLQNDYIEIIFVNSIKKYLKSTIFLSTYSLLLISLNYWTPIEEPGSSITKVMLQILIFYYFIKIIYISQNDKDDEPSVRLASQILIYAMAIVYFSPQIVYLISLFFVINPNYIIGIGTSGDWLSFAGSLIGGSLTLFAVIFTFILDKKQRESDADLRSIPKIITDWNFGKNSKDNSYIKRSLVVINQFNKDEVFFNIKLRLINDSSFLASKLEFIESKLVFFRDIDSSLNDDQLPIDVINFTEEHIKESNMIKFLFNNSEFIMNLPISYPEKYINVATKSYEDYLSRLIVKLKYRSAIGVRDITLTSEVNFHISNPVTQLDKEKRLLLVIIENIRNDYIIKNNHKGK